MFLCINYSKSAVRKRKLGVGRHVYCFLFVSFRLTYCLGYYRYCNFKSALTIKSAQHLLLQALQIYHGNILLMEYITEKLYVIRQS